MMCSELCSRTPSSLLPGGNEALELDVLRFVDDPRATVADLVDDPVLVGDDGPRLQDAEGRFEGLGQRRRFRPGRAERRHSIAAKPRVIPIPCVAFETLGHPAPPLDVGFIPYFGSGSFIFSQMAMNRGSPNSRSKHRAGVAIYVMSGSWDSKPFSIQSMALSG